MKSIVIIGGGFSGALTAINLARLSTAPVSITVINKDHAPCRGVAYSTPNGSHLLNVLARNMSALADQPNHFVEWLMTRSEYVDQPVATVRELFVPRKTYGDYLQSLFHWYSHILAGEKGIQFKWLRAEAVDLVPQGRQVVVTAGDEKIIADKVVLAAGNQPPANLPLRGLDLTNPRYIRNPWGRWDEKLPSDKTQDLLLIGTGLTMVDIILTLQDLGWQGKIHAISRNGLTPLSHFKGVEYPDLLNDEVSGITLKRMLAIFKKHLRKATAQNINPAILVDKLRPFTQRIWQSFSTREKKQFNRRFRTRWNVTRHRIAPQIHQQLAGAIAQNRLEVLKARLLNCEESPTGIKVWLETGGVKRGIEAAAVINCTGPQESFIPSESPLFNNLHSRGLIQPDEMNLGIKVASNFAVVGKNGTSSDVIFALGGLLKGTLWETTAVPELRSQTFRVAEILVSQLAQVGNETPRIHEVIEEVLEYSI